MKKMSKMTIAFALMGLAFITIINVYAATGIPWWDIAYNWIIGGKAEVEMDTSVLDGLSDTLEVIGTGVIAIATVVVGIRYVFGTVDGKVKAKESLMNLIVACVFFFGWSGIRGILISGSATAQGGYKLIFFDGDLSVTFARLFTFLVMIGKVLTVLAVIYLGVKFVFAGADAKAQIKEKAPALIIGIVLIFCATTFLSILVNIITEVI